MSIDTGRIPRRATADQHEVCFNLWAFADVSGLIRRISGKAYILDGSDEQKSAVLRSLAGSDFRTAATRPVPDRLGVVDRDGRRIAGAVLPHRLSEVSLIFGTVLDELSALPVQLCSVAGRSVEFPPPEVEAPLYVLTVVVEHADGRLVPSVR
ncbi:hypothetical protein [Gordonia sp. NPDC003376]